MMRTISFLLTLMVSVFWTGSKAQSLDKKPLPKFSKEISITSENDNYLLRHHDGYYTNGLYIAVRTVSRHKLRKAKKQIMKFELGQMIFNPSSYKVIDVSQMDRPFAGYLYAGLSRVRFYGMNNLVDAGFTVGTIGKASGAEAVQKSYHHFISIYPVKGWNAQIRDEPGINFHLTAAQLHANNKNKLHLVDITTIERVKLGNSFTNASLGVLMRFGKKERTIQTNSWSSRIARGEPDYIHESEIFVFLQPELIYQLYNATVQGGMFVKDKGPVTSAIAPWVYQQRIGLQYANKGFSIHVGAVYKTKEARSMKKHERFGVISMAHRFN